jgi:signal transduction histidine kinase
MDERLEAGRRIVTEVDPGGAAERAGVRSGDQIVSDPGVITFVEPWTERELFEWNYRLHLALKSGHVPMKLRRGPELVEVDVVPLSAPSLPAALRQLRRLVGYMPTAFAFLAIAALLGLRRSPREEDDRARRAVAVGCAMLGPCWLISWPEPGWPAWLFPVASLIDCFGSASGLVLLLAFAWSFPTRSRIVDVPLARSAIVTLGVLSAGYSVLNSMHVIEPVPGFHGNAPLIIFDSLVAIAMLVGLGWQRRRAADIVARRQATWLLVSSAAGVVLPILLEMIPQYAFGYCSPIVHMVLFPMPGLIPLGFAVVLARYRLFAFDGIALRVGPYAVAVVSSVVVCIVATIAVQATLEWHASTMGEAGRWFGVVAAILAVEPIRRGSQKLVDRWFARDRDAFLAQCSSLAAKLAGASDVAAIEAEVSETLDARAVKLVDLEAALDGAVAEELQALLGRSSTMRVLDAPNPAMLDALHALGFELLVALPPAATTKKVLALTLPLAPHWMSRAEHDALALVGRVIGAALAQADARRALEVELLRSQDERRHIAMELHDGLGAALNTARLMTRQLRKGSGEATLDALDEALREGLGDLRASLWGLDPSETSWDDLVARIQRYASDLCVAANVELEMTIEGKPGDAIAAAGRLGIMRVVQEALSNALKHAAPAHISIVIRAVDGKIDLVIEDDGRGLPSEPAGGRGIGNMARRIASLAGTFRVEAREPTGTRVWASLPEHRVVRARPVAIAYGDSG